MAPLAILLAYSFYESRAGGVMIPAFTLRQYIRFLSDPFYLYVLWRTVLLGLWVTAWCIVLGYPLAYILARTRSRHSRSASRYHSAAIAAPAAAFIVVTPAGPNQRSKTA